MRHARGTARDPEGPGSGAGTERDPLELAPRRPAPPPPPGWRPRLRSLDAVDSAVTLPQFRLLTVLADLGRVPSGRAARALGLDPSTITRLADRMVAAGHVTRGTDERHRGVVTLELTASGRHLVTAADDWRRAELARIMARLRPEDQAAVTASLGLLVAAADEEYGIAARHPGTPLTLWEGGRRREDD